MNVNRGPSKQPLNIWNSLRLTRASLVFHLQTQVLEIAPKITTFSDGLILPGVSKVIPGWVTFSHLYKPLTISALTGIGFCCFINLVGEGRISSSGLNHPYSTIFFSFVIQSNKSLLWTPGLTGFCRSAFSLQSRKETWRSWRGGMTFGGARRCAPRLGGRLSAARRDPPRPEGLPSACPGGARAPPPARRVPVGWHRGIGPGLPVPQVARGLRRATRVPAPGSSSGREPEETAERV